MEVYQSSKTAAEMEYALSAVPSIGANGNWFIGDQDTGISAYGVVPSIGENGNWFIGEEDTGIFASGVNVTGAKVGQIIQIEEVNTEGLPISWKAVDFLSAKNLTLINEITLSEEVAGFDISTDKDGNELNEEYLVLRIRCMPKAATERSNLSIYANFRSQLAYNGYLVLQSGSAVPGSDWAFAVETVVVIDTRVGIAMATEAGRLRSYGAYITGAFQEADGTPYMELTSTTDGAMPNIVNLHAGGTLGAGTKIWMYSMR